MIDLESFVKSLKIKWVKRLIVEKNPTWWCLLPNKISNDFIWNYGTIALKDQLKHVSNPFWKDVISAWISFFTAFNTDDLHLCNENIFNSDFAKFKKMRYRSWEKKGVKFIGDLFENSKIMSWERFR